MTDDWDDVDRLTVQANGLEFTCRRAGAGDRLALCLHGFPDDAGSMDPLLHRLADAGYTAVAPYMRGYAPTDPAPDDDYSAESLGEDAVALADVLPDDLDVGAEDPVLVGHDWGAVAAYAADRAEPDAFSRQVTLAVPPGFTPLLFEHPRQFLRSWYVWFFQLPDTPERALRWRDFAFIEFLWATWSPGWDYPAERLESVKGTFRTRNTTERALQYYRDMFRGQASWLVNSLAALEFPSTDDVPPITTPTLVICGADDGCIGPALFEHADEMIEDCRVVRVTDAGHFMHQERPDVVGDEIVTFLGQ